MFNLFGVRVYTTLIVVSDIRDEEDIINNIRENIISAGCFHSTHTVTFSELKEVECSAKFRSEYVQYLKWVLGDPDIVIIGEAYTDDEKKFISSFTDILSSVGISYGYYAKEKEKKEMENTKNNTVKFDTRKILDLKETMDEIILNLTLLNEIDSLFQTNAIAKEYMDEAEYVGSPKPVVEYNKYEHALRCMIKDIINYKNLLVDHEGTIQKLKDENKELTSKIENNETNNQLQNEINKLKCENEALKYNIQKAVEAIRGELHG